MCFLGIGSLDFSEFWHGARNPYEVLCHRATYFGKNIFCLKHWGNGPKIGQKIGFFEFEEKFGR